MPPLAFEALPPAVAEDLMRYAEQLVFEDAKALPALRLVAANRGQLHLCDENGERMEILACPLSFSHLGAALRRAQSAPPSGERLLVLAQGVVLNRRRLVLVGGIQPEAEVTVTHKEAALLELLRGASPQPLTRSLLLDKIWRYDEQIDTRTLETHIYRLRQKLEMVGLSAPLETTADGYVWRP